VEILKVPITLIILRPWMLEKVLTRLIESLDKKVSADPVCFSL
jgi:hypothetical protein